MIHFQGKGLWDLVSPDGVLVESPRKRADGDVCVYEVQVAIEGISPSFRGFAIEKQLVHFNLRSVLGQLGLHTTLVDLELCQAKKRARAQLLLHCYGDVAQQFAPMLPKGALMGKLFAADPDRRVREPYYLERVLGRKDRKGRPLLSFGRSESEHLPIEQMDNRAIAQVPLLKHSVYYDEEFSGLLPTLKRCLKENMSLRQLIALHQIKQKNSDCRAQEGRILLLKTKPLHIRTVFGRIAHDLLPQSIKHTSADILDPNTHASGDIYEFFSSRNSASTPQNSDQQITHVPLEFYTLEPEKEHVFFRDRDQLLQFLDDKKRLFQLFDTLRVDPSERACFYAVKGTQLLDLDSDSWNYTKRLCPPLRLDEASAKKRHSRDYAQTVSRFIEAQAEHPFLKALDEDWFTSEGVLFCKHFPTPLLKRMILSPHVQKRLKRIYFLMPSQRSGEFFSHEDHNFLIDLWSFGIGVYWVDRHTKKILQYAKKPQHHGGIFVPTGQVENYLHSCVFGVYGSNLLAGNMEKELDALLRGIESLKKRVQHPMLDESTPLSFVTGGGPGAMEVGNRVAKKHGVLSCAHIVDFTRPGQTVNEQAQNSYIEAKMTYRIAKLIERQADFNLDFPIFVMGGIGTDFEYALEEVRRKTGSSRAHPVILLGTKEYWHDKVTTRFQRNLKSGTIEGSQWVANAFYRADHAKQALLVYERFFNHRLPIGPEFPSNEEGFVEASSLTEEAL